MKQISLADFQSTVMHSKMPVFLAFHGSFCSACRMMDPLIQQAEERYGSEILFLKADGDHEEMLNTLLNVRTLPCLFFIQNGKVLLKHEGFMPASQLEEALKKLAEIPA